MYYETCCFTFCHPGAQLYLGASCTQAANQWNASFFNETKLNIQFDSGHYTSKMILTTRKGVQERATKRRKILEGLTFQQE